MTIPKDNDPVMAYLEQLAAHHDDPQHTPPPTPPTPEVALEVAARAAKTLAVILDFQKTGKVTLNPSLGSALAAAELLDKRTP